MQRWSLVSTETFRDALNHHLKRLDGDERSSGSGGGGIRTHLVMGHSVLQRGYVRPRNRRRLKRARVDHGVAVGLVTYQALQVAEPLDQGIDQLSVRMAG